MDANISDTTKLFVRYNMQRETQPFVIGLWWRNGEPGAVSVADRSPQPVRLGHGQPHNILSPSLTNERIFAVTYIDFPNQY